MKILIEGENYPIEVLQSLFDDPKFYLQSGMQGRIISVGYYHSFERKELVYMLPKVFMRDGSQTIFGQTSHELLNLKSVGNIKHDKELDWIRQCLVYFYNSLLEYRRRLANSQIAENSPTFRLNSNLGENEYSYLDLLLSFVNFFKKHRSFILHKYIESTSHQIRKPKWAKTVRKSIPIFSNSGAPIYLQVKNKHKQVDSEEELIIYFLSILNHFKEAHDLPIRLDKNYQLLLGAKFSSLQNNGLSKLGKIKYRYFNDTFKQMYRLCEIYFSQSDTSSIKRKREEFISTNNYNLIFEDMVDKLFSDELAQENPSGISISDLKNNDDGKIIDHIYQDQSLLDTSNIYYIGDSKYYKSQNRAGKTSNYKQFTYAKNIIQFNIDLLNDSGKENSRESYNTRYRDELTEGYNITPNFFIYGYIFDKQNFDDSMIEKKGEPIKSFHFKYRLFDRDTLFVHPYQINFLFVLKSYSAFGESNIEHFRTETKRQFRENFLSFFGNPQACEFDFFECVLAKEGYESFVEKNFKELNGKIYLTIDGKLILAKHKQDLEFSEGILSEFRELEVY